MVEGNLTAGLATVCSANDVDPPSLCPTLAGNWQTFGDDTLAYMLDHFQKQRGAARGSLVRTELLRPYLQVLLVSVLGEMTACLSRLLSGL